MRLKTSLMKELYTFTIRFHRIPCVCTIFQAPAAKANIPERHWGWHIPVNDRLCLFSILYITNQSTMEILKSSSEMRISRIHLPCHVWEPPIQDRFWFYCMVNKVTLLPSQASIKVFNGAAIVLSASHFIISTFSKYADFTFPPLLENHSKSTAGIHVIWDYQR